MNKVTTIQLNGRAYQVDESGYEALRSYLDNASAALAGDPDQAEIVRDLEQAVAEKCDRTLSAHKNVVSSEEIAKIIAEMGPVAGAEKQEQTDAPKTEPKPRKLYKIREGALLFGVCNGIGAYFDIDPIIVRIIFIILTIATSGVWIAAYVLLAIFLPSAETPEEKARAFGDPKNAQELVERAKKKYAEMTEKGKAWKKEWSYDRHEARARLRAERARLRHERHMYKTYEQNNVWSVIRPIVDTVIALVWLGVFLAAAIFFGKHWNETSLILHKAIDLIKELIDYAQTL
ncbi:MAG TPA: PspC domain-containing protein [Candidatus Paceibacterota bacterium]|jgi:Putative stress-responsive transcriptional regulator